MATIHTIGRRKTSVARVFLSEGKGEITVNKRPAAEYFPTELLRVKLDQPFELTDTKGSFDVVATVEGGGITGQVEAIRLGISRALCEVNPEYRAKLKPEAMLDNIAKGKLNRFFKDNTLVHQEYIMDNKVSVAQYVASVNKDLKVVAFVRVTIA